LPGLTGGPCLEKDPLILAKSASRVGISSALLTESRRVNLGVPTVALRTISQDTRMAQITEPNFLILGIAFKGRPETSDTRGTLAYKIAKEIKIAFPGSTITGYDPLILENSEIKMIQNLQQAMLKADVILIQHNSDRLLREFKKYAKEFIKSDAIVYDFWGVIESEDLSKNTILYRFGA
jgi:UDP-N-acetyl-D-mannosaminuronate dehydrogenase